MCCLWEVQATLLLFLPVTVQGYREEVNPHGWLLDLFLSLAMDWMDQQALQLSCCCCCPCHLVEWEVGYPEPQEVLKPASHFATCQHKRKMRYQLALDYSCCLYHFVKHGLEQPP